MSFGQKAPYDKSDKQYFCHNANSIRNNMFFWVMKNMTEPTLTKGSPLSLWNFKFLAFTKTTVNLSAVGR